MIQQLAGAEVDDPVGHVEQLGIAVELLSLGHDPVHPLGQPGDRRDAGGRLQTRDGLETVSAGVGLQRLPEHRLEVAACLLDDTLLSALPPDAVLVAEPAKPSDIPVPVGQDVVSEPLGQTRVGQAVITGVRVRGRACRRLQELRDASSHPQEVIDTGLAAEGRYRRGHDEAHWPCSAGPQPRAEALHRSSHVAVGGRVAVEADHDLAAPRGTSSQSPNVPS